MIQKEYSSKKNMKGFFLTPELKLNPAHNYWHQVQAEIAILEVKWADFVAWTKQDILIVRVEKDDAWEGENLPLLSDFYLNTLLPSCYLYEDD